MNILAIDNSTQHFSVALEVYGSLSQSSVFKAATVEKFTIIIDDLLKRSSVDLTDIDCFVMGTGPGSFTGLRMAVSILKGFHMATGKPCIGIPSYIATTKQYCSSGKPCALIFDAKKDLIYGAVYTLEDGGVKNLVKEDLYQLEDFLINRCNSDYLFVGESTAFADRIAEVYPFAPILSTVTYPEARFLIAEAKKVFDAGGDFDPKNIELLYIHPDTCTVRR